MKRPFATVMLVSAFLAAVFAGDSRAESGGRLRVMVLNNEQYNGCCENGLVNERVGIDYQELSVEPTMTGVRMDYITSSGFGLGYSVFRLASTDTLLAATDIPIESSTVSSGEVLLVDALQVDLQFLDLSYTLGDRFTFTFGGGYLVNGRGSERLDFGDTLEGAARNAGLNVIDIEIENEVSARSWFFGFGWSVGDFEILVNQYVIDLTLGFDTSIGEKILTSNSYVTFQRAASRSFQVQTTNIGLGWFF